MLQVRSSDHRSLLSIKHSIPFPDANTESQTGPHKDYCHIERMDHVRIHIRLEVGGETPDSLQPAESILMI